MFAEGTPGGIEFLPHGTCFLWQPQVLWLTVFSDAAIALAYYSIPIALFYVLRKRTDAPFNGVVALFGLFIVLCGTTHVVDIVNIWRPIYWIGSWINVATAIVSVLTAIVLVRVVPGLLRLPSPTIDTLTGLPNRLLLLDRLGQTVGRARRAGESFGVLFVDLDRFKEVNDSLGHGAGDALLVAVASRLRNCVRPSDVVARFGGDEFVILLERATTEQAGDVASRIIDSLDQPFALGGQSITIGASIGVVLSTGDSSPLDVIEDADRAMYDTKVLRRGGYTLVDGARAS